MALYGRQLEALAGSRMVLTVAVAQAPVKQDIGLGLEEEVHVYDGYDGCI